MVVDLPAPLGPSRPRQMPRGTSRSSPSTAVIEPNRLTTPRSWMAGVLTVPTLRDRDREAAPRGSGDRGLRRRVGPDHDELGDVPDLVGRHAHAGGVAADRLGAA